jgi:hypothetical protein
MKSALIACLTLATAVAGAPAGAEILLLNAGVTCRPATAADVDRLSYRDGSAANIHPGSAPATHTATVTCALPPVPPGHRLVRASAFLYDLDRRWSRCAYFNLAPGVAPRAAMTVSVAGAPVLGHATVEIDTSGFVPHAVRCPVRPGQALYGIETEVAPWP